MNYVPLLCNVVFWLYSGDTRIIYPAADTRLQTEASHPYRGPSGLQDRQGRFFEGFESLDRTFQSVCRHGENHFIVVHQPESSFTHARQTEGRLPCGGTSGQGIGAGTFTCKKLPPFCSEILIKKSANFSKRSASVFTIYCDFSNRCFVFDQAQSYLLSI